MTGFISSAYQRSLQWARDYLAELEANRKRYVEAVVTNAEPLLDGDKYCGTLIDAWSVGVEGIPGEVKVFADTDFRSSVSMLTRGQVVKMHLFLEFPDADDYLLTEISYTAPDKTEVHQKKSFSPEPEKKKTPKTVKWYHRCFPGKVPET